MSPELGAAFGSTSSVSPLSDVDRGLRRLAFGAIFAAVVLAYSAGGPPWLNSLPIDLLYVAFGGLVYAQAAYRRRHADGVRFLPALVLTLVLGGLFYGVGWGGGFTTGYRTPELVVSFGLFVAYPFAHPDGLDHLSEVPVYALGVVALLGAHFFYSALVGARFPFYVGFMLVMNVLFLPRYVSRRTFLTTVSLTGGVVAALGMLAYVVGEYAVLSIPVTLRSGTFAVPVGLEGTNPILQSIFTNPNGTGILLFAGVFAAVVELHRAIRDGARPAHVVAAAGLVALDGVGLFLTNSRASWLAATVGVGVYLGYAAGGRRGVRYTVVGTVALVGLGLLGMATSVVDVSASGRFALWGAAIEAFVARPSLFGAGLVGTADLLAPYVPAGYVGTSAHNSYLVILLRTGIVGLGGYLVVTVGSVIDATYLRESGDPAMIGLALAFAVHQLFEAYTIVQYSLGAVLAALAVGYLVTGDCAALCPDSPPTTGFRTPSIEDPFERG